MDAGNIEALLRALGAEKVRSTGGGWVRCSCPFSPWTHKKGRDRKPSFAVRVSSDGSYYRCMACGEKGSSAVQLIRRFEVKSHTSQSDLVMFASDHDQRVVKTREASLIERLSVARFERKPVIVAGVALPSTGSKNWSDAAIEAAEKKIAVLNELVMDKFDEIDGPAQEYLTGRSIGADGIATWGLRWHPGAMRIAIPIRDWKGRLVGISGRDIRRYDSCRVCGSVVEDGCCTVCDWAAPPKFLHSRGFQREMHLYGENLVDRTLQTGYLVEGFFDAIYMRQMGYPNVIALMGTFPNVVQSEKMVKMFNELIIVPDGDDAGYAMADHVNAAVGSRISVRVVQTPRGIDPDELDTNQLTSIVGWPARKLLS